ncbi:MAG: phosphoribosyl-AMP cyclohydrolase [Thermodesulfobacteriota bacterium]|nr:phosphoribosyl-AMP cyclohydrolase [Thermodesulfobacteriota bacterium]
MDNSLLTTDTIYMKEVKAIDKIKFDDDGLVPAIIQDVLNGQVLMIAYMNRKSLYKTLHTGKTHFFSRKRKNIWLKGETSGHFQIVREVFIDCDSDALLIKVEQKVAACHTGFYSCFYRKIEEDRLKEVGQKVFDPEKVYK